VLKFLLNTGVLLTNRLLIWDGTQARAEEICVEKNPSCESCGMGEKIKKEKK
jgi:adenylyltransferase/sulfurtransferase